MSNKLIITGTVGINHELIELHNNFPRFSLLHSDQELLARATKQGKLILEQIKEKKVNDNNVSPDSKEIVTH